MEERHENEVRSEPDVGRKGGAASMAAGVPYAEERGAVALWTRDLVRWGPIWAGLVLALAIQLVLGAIGLALSLRAYDPTSANYTERVTSMLSIWTAVSSLISLFIGGYIAGRMASVLGLRNGLAQGSVLWALALVVGIVLSALGAAGLVSTLPNVGGLLGRGGAMISPEQAAVTATGAWWFVIGSVLAWAAAAFGGVLGAAAHREELAGAPQESRSA